MRPLEKFIMSTFALFVGYCIYNTQQKVVVTELVANMKALASGESEKCNNFNGLLSYFGGR